MGSIAWSWRNVAFGAVLAIPASTVAVFDPAMGIPLAIGVVPAAALGMLGPRSARSSVAKVGAVAGGSILLGATASPVPVVAVLTLFALCVVVATLAGDPRRRFVSVLLTLGLPLYGAGLSIGSWEQGLAAGLLIVSGSLYAWLISLLWPSRPAASRAEPATAPRRAMAIYGVQIGLAGSMAAAIGFLTGVDHPGWGATSALLVSRPQRRQLDARAIGRVASVGLGALVASLVALISPSPSGFAILSLLTLAVGTGMAGSRWYVFPFFSTVLVLTMLLLDDGSGPHWFLERVGLTLLGVALALVFAWLVPLVTRSNLRQGASDEDWSSTRPPASDRKR